VGGVRTHAWNGLPIRQVEGFLQDAVQRFGQVRGIGFVGDVRVGHVDRALAGEADGGEGVVELHLVPDAVEDFAAGGGGGDGVDRAAGFAGERDHAEGDMAAGLGRNVGGGEERRSRFQGLQHVAEGREAAGAVTLAFAGAGAVDGPVAERASHGGHHLAIGVHRDEECDALGLGHHHVGEIGLAVPADGDGGPVGLRRFPEVGRVGDDARGQAQELQVVADEHAAEEIAHAGAVEPTGLFGCGRGGVAHSPASSGSSRRCRWTTK
jgi:hypothetical protein